MRLFLEITDTQPPDVSKRRFKEFSRAGMNAIGLLWDRLFKMRHFDADAASKYGYQPRGKKYQAGKVRRVRGRSFKVSPDAERPLILTGAFRKAVKMRQIPRSFPTRVTLALPTPHYVAMRPRRPGIPNLGLEMTSTLFAERREMQAEYHREVESELNDYRQPRTTKVG
jgi:hypothetical protein